MQTARFIIVLIFALLNACNLVNAQDQKTQLRIEKEKIEKELDYASKLLEIATSNRKASMEELILINKKISERENLITNITKELSYLSSQIRYNQRQLDQMRDDLTALKSEYAKLIYYAYKNNSKYDRLMFIFSAQSFNQAFQRLRYLQYYTDYRKNQAFQITNTIDSISSVRDLVKEQQSQKTGLLSSHKLEESNLRDEKNAKDKTVQDLSKEERKLRKSIREKRKEAERLTAEIESIIAAEIQASNEKARSEGEETTDGGFALTPEEMELSGNFATNKGKLPWPSERGVISSTFGEHNHPVLKRVKIKNNGIDILTNAGEKARAVYNGTVISVRTITNTNKAIIIRHGDYFTVYSNLSESSVGQGDKVEARQSIGTVYTDPSKNKTELHFEIWKGKTLLNPSPWILRQ